MELGLTAMDEHGLDKSGYNLVRSTQFNPTNWVGL
ncbi:hypothetical protein A2U01_0088142, partial [Trifolium medium]|nr:hypothetical protein [Trifolium medium]